MSLKKILLTLKTCQFQLKMGLFLAEQAYIFNKKEHF